MTDSKPCPRCGTPTRSDEGPGGLCAPCLMKMGFDSRSGAADVVFTGTEDDPRPPAPPIADLAAHFPELEIRELVAQGGMGCVYRARQISLERDVALKILTVGTGDPSFAGRFEREARTLAGLSHPGIVSIFEFGTRGPWTFLLMEFVEGASLRQMMRAKTLGPRTSLSIVTQMCDALQFAHDQGVVHRDIKPENVLVARDGRVKVLDFGLAKLVRGPQATNLTQTRQVMGTPHYMAPEQWEKPASVDHRADIYALGVVFYELLTGELPLGRFQPPSHMVAIDVRLDDVVLKSLEKEPDRRYQHASEVRDKVSGIAATPGAVLPPGVTPRRRISALSCLGISIAFFVVCVVVATAGLLLYGGRRVEPSAPAPEAGTHASGAVPSEGSTAPSQPVGSDGRKGSVSFGFVDLHVSPELGRRRGLDASTLDALNGRLAQVWSKYLLLESEHVKCAWLPDGWLEVNVEPAAEQHAALLQEADEQLSIALGEQHDLTRYDAEMHRRLESSLRFGAKPEHIAILVEKGISFDRRLGPGQPESSSSMPPDQAYVRLWQRMLPARPQPPK